MLRTRVWCARMSNTHCISMIAMVSNLSPKIYQKFFWRACVEKSTYASHCLLEDLPLSHWRFEERKLRTHFDLPYKRQEKKTCNYVVLSAATFFRARLPIANERSKRTDLRVAGMNHFLRSPRESIGVCVLIAGDHETNTTSPQKPILLQQLRRCGSASSLFLLELM